MSTIVTRVGKGSPLTWTEVDSNFTNLNTDKLQSGDTAASLTITSATINGGSINGTTVGASTASSGAFTTLSATGVTTVQAGTVSLPAITTTGDTNTGIFFPAADTIAFTKGGAEVMRIDSGGNVGIRTTSISSRLDINSTSNWNFSVTNLIRSASNTNSPRFIGMPLDGDSLTSTTVGAYNAIWGVYDSAPTTGSTSAALNSVMVYGAYAGHRWVNNGTEYMRITSTGNVGIGTSSPSAKLDVSVSGLLAIKSTASTGTSGIYNQFTNTGGSFYIGIDSSTASTFAAGNYAATLQNTTSGNMVIDQFTSNSIILKTANTERMRIDSSGNVGIGTSSPSYKLSVNSSNGINSYDGVSGKGRFVLGDPADPSGYVGMYRSAIANIGTAGNDLTIGSYNQIGFTTGAAAFSSQTERMRITAGGEVYIAGTADQGAYNLQCNGTGVWGAGAYVNGSDARIKENIVSIDSGLDVVNKLNPVTYTYKEDWSKDQSTQTGFIAQELLVALEGKNYVDGIVQQGGEYMSVAYQNIIPLLTKAIQELSAKVETLEAQLQGK